MCEHAYVSPYCPQTRVARVATITIAYRKPYVLTEEHNEEK